MRGSQLRFDSSREKGKVFFLGGEKDSTTEGFVAQKNGSDFVLDFLSLGYFWVVAKTLFWAKAGVSSQEYKYA